MAAIRFESVTKRFQDGTVALDEVSFDVRSGELLVVLGPSGSGKTTVLKLIGGLDLPTTGTVLKDGTPITDIPPSERDTGMVFQDGALFPHLSAGDNIAFPLKIQGIGGDEQDSKVAAEAEKLGLSRFLPRKPKELSAGHRHGVAVGRAVVREPSVLLMDEPLALLDAHSRARMRLEVLRLHRESGSTMVYVTNDQSEAMAIADRIAVLGAGRLRQLGTPEDVYSRPQDTFVATFIGAMNLVPAQIDDGTLVIGEDRLTLPNNLASVASGSVVAGIRQQHATRAKPGTPFDRCLHVTVVHSEWTGSDLLVHTSFGDAESGAIDFVARFDPSDQIGSGETLELSLNMEHLSIFDPDTGNRIGQRAPPLRK